MKAILVTACPAGIATSFLAAKRIEQQAKLAGWELTLDVDSSVQPRQVPSKEQIAAADLVLVVASAPVDLAAYDGKSLYRGDMDLALQDPAALLDAARSGASVYRHEAAPAVAKPASGAKRIVAVTACPTGVAHTFMSAEALETMAKQLGHQIRVETQGSVGAQNALTADEIAAADLVFLATDIEVDMARFDGKPVYSSLETLPTYLDSAALRSTLANAVVSYMIDPQRNQWVVFVPVVYYQTTQGALVVVFDLNAVTQRVLPRDGLLGYRLRSGGQVLYEQLPASVGDTLVKTRPIARDGA